LRLAVVMTASRLRSAVATTWRLRGARGLARAVLGRVWWHARYVRFRVDLAGWETRPPEPGIEAREGSWDELIRFRTGRDVPAEFHDDRLRGPRRFYLGLVDGEIGHITWVFTHRDGLFHIDLAPGEIALDGLYTFARFRGRGLMPAVERAALDDARREGVRAAYTHVRVDNVASLRGTLKTGFTPIGVVTIRRTLGIRRRRFVPGIPPGLPVVGAIRPAPAA
jgi:RimJ/RimL family protein N-acetyltransferase